MLGDIDTTGDNWESLDAEDFPMEEAEPKQDLSTDRQIQQPEQGQLVQQPQIESVTRQIDPSAVQRQLMQHPQFPADAQMQRFADGRNWQVVPTRWWEQPRPQRQQMQHRMGRFEEQAPQPWQQLPHPQQRMQRPEHWNFGEESGEQFTPQPSSYRQWGGSSRGRRQVKPNPSESPVQQIVNVEQLPQNPRLLNVGPKPTKWAGNTPLSAFKTDLILHYRATELPK